MVIFMDKYIKEEKERIDKEYSLIEELNSYQEKEKRILDIEIELIDELSRLRKEKQLSQKELCEIINFKQPTLAKIEKRKNSPQLSTLIKILDALDYHIEFKKNSN
ncbi:MAG: helix-turn-helix transcriptional regulator [Firmicutes bacterium]|nr:helix-turn-helix transcriptional regulator [Bacillota bacterium]